MPLSAEEFAIEQKMNGALAADPSSAYLGFDLERDASGINIPEVLRHRRMANCYDQDAFGLYRYNMFQEKGDWFPGAFATDERVANIDSSNAPTDLDVQAMIAESHTKFYKPKDEAK